MYEWYFMYKDIVPEKTRKHEVAFQGPRLPLLSMPRIAPPVSYYYRYPYGVYYRRYYASPGIHISVRL